MELEYYDAPYLDEAEHALIDHTGIPGVGEGGGGGAAFIDLLQTTHDFSQTSLPDGVPIIFILDPTFAGGAFAREQGTAVTFNVSDPTRLTIDADGYYEIHGALTVTNGTENFSFTVGIQINGASIPYVENGSCFFPSTTSGTDTITSKTALYKLPLTAGDYVEFTGGQSGNSSVDNGIQLFLASVFRVA